MQLRLPALPALPGALECLAAGVTSTLHPANSRGAGAVINNWDQLSPSDPRCLLLFDPQTAGGLLAALPDDGCADACLAALRQAGYADACIVGRVLERLDGGAAGADADGSCEAAVPLVHVALD